MTGRDPKSIIDAGAMAVGQWLAVLVTLGLNAVDGFDVLSISFASPGIARDWGIDKATLGWVLSMELFGMALGSLLLGGVADKVGRRPTILGCLAAMAIGMFGAGQGQGVAGLLFWRVVTRPRLRGPPGPGQCPPPGGFPSPRRELSPGPVGVRGSPG